MPKLDEYLRIKEAAEYLGVCQNTLRNWEAAGNIPVHRHPLNNYRLFKIRDLERVLKTTEGSAAGNTGSRRRKRPR